MKKGLVLIAALALMAGMAPSLFAEPAENFPRWFRQDFTQRPISVFI